MKTVEQKSVEPAPVANAPVAPVESPIKTAFAAIGEELKAIRPLVLTIAGRTPGFTRTDKGSHWDGADLSALRKLLKGRPDDEKTVARAIALLNAARALKAL